jgi:hypothetical protein
LGERGRAGRCGPLVSLLLPPPIDKSGQIFDGDQQ